MVCNGPCRRSFGTIRTERNSEPFPPSRTRTLVDCGATLHPLGKGRYLAGPLRTRERPGPCLGHGVPRWHEHSGPSQGGKSGPKGGFRGRGGDRDALGRSRGGFGSKICVAADGHGKALSFTLTSGQAHELPSAIALLDALPHALSFRDRKSVV